MIATHGRQSQEDEQAEANRQTTSLAALAALLLLVILGLQLIHILSTSAAVEDCLLAGGRDCDAIVHPLVPPPFP